MYVYMYLLSVHIFPGFPSFHDLDIYKVTAVNIFWNLTVIVGKHDSNAKKEQISCLTRELYDSDYTAWTVGLSLSHVRHEICSFCQCRFQMLLKLRCIFIHQLCQFL